MYAYSLLASFPLTLPLRFVHGNSYALFFPSVNYLRQRKISRFKNSSQTSVYTLRSQLHSLRYIVHVRILPLLACFSTTKVAIKVQIGSKHFDQLVSLSSLYLILLLHNYDSFNLQLDTKSGLLACPPRATCYKVRASTTARMQSPCFIVSNALLISPSVLRCVINSSTLRAPDI
jgi:hypothetical protein